MCLRSALRGDRMKVLVCGGRNYNDHECVFKTLDRLHAEHTFSHVIHGACGWDADHVNGIESMRGADALADAWARARGVPLYRVPAAWSRLGHIAGPTRNSGMLAYNPDLVVAFPGWRGTANMIKQATKAGVRVERIQP